MLSESQPCSKLGLLVMSGYAWPTQPGDVDDLRTWCRVDPDEIDNPDYTCLQPYGKDEFGMVKARINDLVFGSGPHGIENYSVSPAIYNQLKSALKILLKDESVCAITGNVGFMAQIQHDAENAINELVKESGGKLKRKPMALGIPSLMGIPQWMPGWGHDIGGMTEEDRIILFTSNFAAFAEKADLCTFLMKIAVTDSVRKLHVDHCSEWASSDSCSLQDVLKTEWQKTYGEEIPYGRGWHKVHAKMDELGGWDMLPQNILLAYAKSIANIFIPVGANNMTGYSGVDLTGGFHSVHAVIETLKNKSDPANIVQQAINATEARGRRVVGAIMGSTEMPPHSNFLRKNWNLPTWDISTLGICLVRAGKTGGFPIHDKEILYNTMKDPTFRACMVGWWSGKKLEPKFGNQEDGSLKWYDHVNKEELETLECYGGRGSFLPPIGRLMENYDVGQPRTFKVNPICWNTKNGMCFPPPNGGTCLFPTPGSADCGSDLAPCGVFGEKEFTKECQDAKNASKLDCVALTKDFVKVDDFGKYFCSGPKPKCQAKAVVGSCFHVGCFWGHGNAHCESTKCVCDEGYCSKDGWTCVKTDNSTLALAASANDNSNGIMSTGSLVALISAAGIMIFFVWYTIRSRTARFDASATDYFLA